jgi:hypothetical protein
MKIFLFFVLVPFVTFSQVQIGASLQGDASDDRFGSGLSMSADGTVLAVGAFYNDANGPDAGHVKVFKNNAGTWAQIGTSILGAEAGAGFGYSVALSADGTVLAVGAIYTNANTGSVTIYKNIANNWVQVGNTIIGEDSPDQFGYSLALSSDGTVLVVGAFTNADNGINAGNVSVYKNIANNWTQIGNDIDGEPGDLAGSAVAMSADGSLVAIGSPENDTNAANAGQVRVFQQIDGNWQPLGNVLYGNDLDGYFGSSLSFSANGTILVIGEINGINDTTNQNTGVVYVYKFLEGNWTLLGNKISGSSLSDNFGHSTALSNDGTILAIGAPTNDTLGQESGALEVYQYIGNQWIPVVNNLNGQSAGDFFGWRVKLSSDGKTLAVSSFLNDNSNGADAGQVKVFDITNKLSTNNFNNNHTLIIYPNPATHFVNIKLPNQEGVEQATIYNALGQILKSTKESNIDVSAFQNGIYYMDVKTNTNHFSTKIIKE